MIADPVYENDYYNSNKSGDLDLQNRSQMLGNQSFRFTSTKEERLIEAMNKNAMLESSPT